MLGQHIGQTYVEVRQCSIHGVVSVMFSNEPTKGSTRITPSKCCGLWDKKLAGWWVSSGDIAKDLADNTVATP